MRPLPITRTARGLAPLLLAPLLVAGAASTLAEDSPLTLRETMSRARAQSHEVAAARSRVESGEQRLRQAKGYRLPNLSFHEIWMRTDSPAEVFALQLNQQRFDFGDFVLGDPNNPDPIVNALSRFELMQPVYTGGELGRRIDQARFASESARAAAEWAGDGAALQAAVAYIQLAQVRENVTLLERSLETVSAHVELARAYTDQGMLVRSELLRAEVERSRIEDFLSEARGQAGVAEANLAFRLAEDPVTSWKLLALPDPTALAEPLESWLGTADGRPDLEAARRLLDAGRLEARIQKAGLYPKVGVVARFDWNDDKPFGTNGDASSIMAVASLNLFSGGRHRAAARAARADAEAGARDIDRFTEGIRLEVRGAWARAVSARERHATALDAQDAAREAERITEERFKKGVVRMLDLLDASTALREAETRELVARAEAHLATLELAVRSGRSPETVLGPAPVGATPDTDDDPSGVPSR